MFGKLRVVRWVLAAIGAVAIWRGGASIFDQPERELVYSTRPPFGSCAQGRCVGIYILEVGNTGSSPEPRVDVRVRSKPLESALLPPEALAFGKVRRPLAVSEAEGLRTYTLADIKPGERIELRFLLSAADGASLAAWDEVLVGVENGAGAALRGDAALLTFGRWMHRLLGGW
jgi:hypothetical protein